MKTGYVLLAAYGLVLAMGILFGTVAVVELERTTTRLEHVVTDSAQTVIDVERGRAASDRLGLAVRSYLFTQNDKFQLVTEQAAAQFRERLLGLSGRLQGTPSAALVQRIRDLDLRGQAELDQISRWQRPLSPVEATLTVERLGQPLREEIDSLFERLSQSENLRFRDATHEATLAATRATQLLSSLALIALVMAVGLTLALVRTLRLLGRSRKALERSVQTLEVVNQDLDAFVGRSAHDLRNIIAPLGLIAELLPRKWADPASLQRCADRLGRIARTAHALIDSYLAFARAGQPASPQDSADVQVVLGEILEDLAPVAAERRAQLKAWGDEASVLCSPSFLHTVLMNLIGNGLKYLDGGPRRKVEVSVRLWPGICEIRVSDGGPGIPRSAQAQIFEPFFRMPGVQAPGNGIGLATVSRIVHAHAGTLRVESAPGQGSTFIVRLPRADVPEHSEVRQRPISEAASTTSSPPDSKSPRPLVGR
jgi:signal transduction histidine kinase